MRVAVVDDDPYIISLITNMISAYWRDIPYEQDDFINGLEFIQSIPSNDYNIVFMDIEMDIIDGIEAVKRLREIDINENIYVIYISSHTDNAYNLFSFHPFGFLKKPIVYEDIANTLKAIERDMQKNQEYISITVDRKAIIVSLNDVIFVQSAKHKLSIFLYSGKILDCYMKMEDLEKKITCLVHYFIRIHTSYLVNKHYIELYKRESISVKGVELPVSRKYRDFVLKNFHESC